MRNEQDNLTKPSDSLRDDAIELVLRVRFGSEPEEVLDTWRHLSAGHAAAALEAETLWRQIGNTQAAADFTTEPALRRPEWRTGKSYVGRRALLTGALAAGSAAIVIGSGAFGPPTGFFADYTTRTGERRDIALPDGSVACLNTASALSFTANSRERRANLESGECLFEVSKDPTRPFSVEAMNGQVRAAAPSVFAMRRQDDAVRVVAIGGRLQVTAGNAAAPPLDLSKGEAVTYDEKRILGGIDRVDTDAASAWRRGKLIFKQRPLSEVVAELERYRYGRIMIVDSALSDLPVTGVFDLADTAGTLTSIEEILPVRVTHLPLLTLLS